MMTKNYSFNYKNHYITFVRSFVLCGQEPSLLWTPACRPSIGPVRMPMEREEGNWLVYTVCARRAGEVG